MCIFCSGDVGWAGGGVSAGMRRVDRRMAVDSSFVYFCFSDNGTV